MAQTSNHPRVFIFDGDINPILDSLDLSLPEFLQDPDLVAQLRAQLPPNADPGEALGFPDADAYFAEWGEFIDFDKD